MPMNIDAPPLQVQRTRLPGVLLLQPRVFADARGFFMESWNQRAFAAAVGQPVTFVQDNHSRSRRGVLRGLHYQVQVPQAKLVRVTRGRVFDVAVDMRRSSPTFGRWTGAVLSADNALQMWLPAGLAHGFLVLSEVADVCYKTTSHHAPALERCLRWDDAGVGVTWPLSDNGGAAPLLSARDAAGARWQDAEYLP